jgi:hypothetical protein
MTSPVCCPDSAVVALEYMKREFDEVKLENLETSYKRKRSYCLKKKKMVRHFGLGWFSDATQRRVEQ